MVSNSKGKNQVEALVGDERYGCRRGVAGVLGFGRPWLGLVQDG